ncbi:site-specific integrase [Fodinicurvata sediminis]|uniref:site-specific integrase n=1 Tax=Fodinicurvata sediminis TaxID=1121832 RepID=UPI0009DB919A|nr:site-specific integrase [Fodinicurvata sediminis]
MANITPHLQRRGARYYFRKRLPWLFAKSLRKTHLVRSLHTACPQIARRQARRLSARLEDAFQDVEQMSQEEHREPTRAELDQILMDIFTEILDAGELHRAARTKGYRAEPVEEELSPAYNLLGMSNAEWHQARAELKLELNDLEDAERTVRPKLDHYNLELPEDSAERKLFLRQVLATETAAHRVEIDREAGNYYAPVHPFVQQVSPAGMHASQASLAASRELLSDAYKDWLDTKKKENQCTENYAKQADYALQLWVALMGDKPFAEVQRSDAIKFRSELAGLPAMSGRKFYADTSPQDASTLRSEIQAQLDAGKAQIRVKGQLIGRDDAERFARALTAKTINRHLGYLSEFFGWKIDSSGYSFQNPFTNSFFPKKTVRKQANKRKTWQTSELNELFRAPLWTGYKNHRNRKTPGPVLQENIRFWAPLVALHSGMREEEVCSLQCEHIVYNDDADSWLFYVEKGKTENAERFVPIHPNLVEAGFLDFVEWSRKQNQRYLFYKEASHFSSRTESQRLSKFFTNYRKSIDLYRAGMDFHSLRHNFRTRFQQEYQGDTRIVDWVTGHSSDSEVAQLYFHGYRARDIANAVSALDFEVDLTHLANTRGKRLRALEVPHRPASKD